VGRFILGITIVAKKPENLSFEESLCELEKIVADLEHGDVALDDALKQFERGIKLVRNSQHKLDNAQQKVTVLMTQEGVDTLKPYDSEGE